MEHQTETTTNWEIEVKVWETWRSVFRLLSRTEKCPRVADSLPGGLQSEEEGQGDTWLSAFGEGGRAPSPAATTLAIRHYPVPEGISSSAPCLTRHQTETAAILLFRLFLHLSPYELSISVYTFTSHS